MTEEAKLERIVVRVTEDEKQQIDLALAARRTKAQPVLKALLDRWLEDPGVTAGSPPAPSAATGRHAEYHAMLDEILDHGTEADVIGIQANLRWGSESVRRASPSGRRRKASNE